MFRIKITKKGIVIALIEALMGFILWTIFLTPYVLGVTRMSWEQYQSWLLMQAILVPLIAILVVKITNKVTKKIKGRME